MKFRGPREIIKLERTVALFMAPFPGANFPRSNFLPRLPASRCFSIPFRAIADFSFLARTARAINEVLITVERARKFSGINGLDRFWKIVHCSSPCSDFSGLLEFLCEFRGRSETISTLYLCVLDLLLELARSGARPDYLNDVVCQCVTQVFRIARGGKWSLSNWGNFKESNEGLEFYWRNFIVRL